MHVQVYVAGAVSHPPFDNVLERVGQCGARMMEIDVGCPRERLGGKLVSAYGQQQGRREHIARGLGQFVSGMGDTAREFVGLIASDMVAEREDGYAAVFEQNRVQAAA